MSLTAPNVLHPLLPPLQHVLRTLKVELRDDDVLLLAGAFNRSDPRADPAWSGPARGLDAFFDFAEAAGANCELFRSADATLGVRRARELARLAERRWRPTPILAILAVDGEPMPVVLDRVDAEGCECRSSIRTERLTWADVESRWLDGSVLACPVPSLQMMVAPDRYDPAEALHDALLHQFVTLATGVDGLAVLESWLERRPSPDELAGYRDRARRVLRSNGDWGGDGRRMLAVLTRRHLPVAESLASEFERVADAFDAFVAGDDAALAESVDLERNALRTFLEEAE